MHELDTITSSTHIHVVNASYQLCDIWLTTVAFNEDYQLLVGMQVDSFDHQTQFTTYRLSTLTLTTRANSYSEWSTACYWSLRLSGMLFAVTVFKVDLALQAETVP